ncbi:Regulator of G protein signaling superfamily [Apiospora marii]|uniref:Regulator of G protein signaling superfamily n=1 Tax=Apiospora marii TaxID=335849 RepID=A0ABR1RUG6_9PEZI
MQLPSCLVWYKKPEYRDIKEYSSAIVSGRRSLSPDGRGKISVPRSLALERGAGQQDIPLSLYDFYMYLKYIEYSPENLEFYIWFKNYEKNYRNGTFGKSDGGLHMIDSATTLAEETFDGDDTYESVIVTYMLSRITDSSLTPTADGTVEKIAQLISPETKCARGTKCVHSTQGGSYHDDEDEEEQELKETPANARARKTLSWQQAMRPTTEGGIIPEADRHHRAELSAVVHTFLLPGSRSELNIPPAMREQVVQALRTSSDPACLKPVADHVYGLLRNCSHRNFIRLGVGNGTFETVCMATSAGIVLTLAGLLTALLLAFTPREHAHSRASVLAAWPLWWVGLSLVLSGLRGSCFFLLLFSRRQPLPWERYDDSPAVLSEHARKSRFMRFVSRMMIFDRKWKVQDQHLRNLQRKIVTQSLIGGAIFASIGVLIFVFLPVWREPL